MIVIPDCESKLASKSASPNQLAIPSLKIVVLGPGILFTSPVLKTTPFAKGNAGFVFSK